MKYKILVVDKESKKIEAIIGDNLNDYYAEKLEAETKLLIDNSKFEIKIINAF